MKLKKILLGSLAGVLLASSALAQGVNQVPQVGTISAINRNATYAAVSVNLVTAASATDIVCIAASATRNISIRRITINGTAGTTITTPFLLYRRAVLDTGGTPATSTALPVAAAVEPADPVSGATLVAYTANPTINDNSPALVGAFVTSIATTTTATPLDSLSFGTSTDMFERGLNLQKNTTQQLCVNLNGVTISSPLLTVTLEWQESL